MLMLTAQQSIPYCDAAGRPTYKKELIIFVSGFNLKQIPVYKFSRVHKANDAGSLLHWSVEYNSYYQKACLPAYVSVWHTLLPMMSV
jgi:hypothetical protein